MCIVLLSLLVCYVFTNYYIYNRYMEENVTRPVDRIKLLCEWLVENKVIKTTYAFEKVCNLSKHYIKNLAATEKGNAGVDTIAKIYDRFPLVSLEWLVCGTGRMFRIRGTSDEIAEEMRKRLIERLI